MRSVRRGLIGPHVRWAAFALAGLVVAACSASGSAAPSSAATATSTPPPAPAQTTSSSLAPSVSPAATASKGPATAQFALTGSAGLTGPVTTKEIVCGQPSFDGPQITFQGQSGTAGPQIVIFVSAGHVEARVATGVAATLRLRSFVGTGVTSFDAASGAQLDSPLTESTAAGDAVGDLGALSSISGTIDCGNQQPGTANIVVSGLSPLGSLDAALSEFKVTCRVTATGTYVGIVGLSMAGTTPVLVFVTASTAMLQVAVEIKTSGSFYTAKGAGLTTLVPGGVSIAGDVTETVKAGATPHTLHVMGDATCGTTVQL